VFVMSETTSQFKKQFPMNALMAILSFMTYSVSAIWLTPYLVGHMGAAAYGLVPLAGLFTQYVSVITAQISSAVSRFLTVELLKPEGNPNVIFNSAFALYALLFLIQLPLFTLGIAYADRIFSIPETLRIDALLLLGCSAGSFLFSLLGAVFGVSLFARNRLDIGYGFNLARLIARIILIVILFACLGPKLRYIGFVDLGLNAIQFVVEIVVWKRLTPHLYLSFRHIDLKILNPIFKMSFWTLVTQLGALLYLRTDIWIINRFISPVLAGKYAAVLVVANFVRQLASLFGGQFFPTVMNYWAKDELDNLLRMLAFSVKFLAFGLTIPVAFICLNADAILVTWLGEDFNGFALLLTFLCIHLPLNNAVTLLFQFMLASNRVKAPALITFLLGILNVVVSYWLGVVYGMGVIGVALATAVVLTLKNALFAPLYAARVLKVNMRVFLAPLTGWLVVLLLVYALSFVPRLSWFKMDVVSWSGLILKAGFVGVVTGVIGWFFWLKATERNMLLGMIPEGLRNCGGRAMRGFAVK